MAQGLLANIFYGDEISSSEGLMRWARTMPPAPLDRAQLTCIEEHITAFFQSLGTGIFGGPIVAGDAVVIASFMEMVRPAYMLEFGVASGLSSSFILSYARVAGLLSQQPFLYSTDLMHQHSPGSIVGDYLRIHFPELISQWVLQTGLTSYSYLAAQAVPAFQGRSGPVLAFVDAGHNHPWPTVDLFFLWKTLPRGSWVVMQDTHMMERWIADCIVHNVACPAPVRGVNWALSHWPGGKVLGFDTAYNSAAVCLDIDDYAMREFIKVMLRYPDETSFLGHAILRDF